MACSRVRLALRRRQACCGEAYLADKGIPLSDCAFYTDSYTDLPVMLRWSTTAVHPDPPETACSAGGVVHRRLGRCLCCLAHLLSMRGPEDAWWGKKRSAGSLSARQRRTVPA